MRLEDAITNNPMDSLDIVWPNARGALNSSGTSTASPAASNGATSNGVTSNGVTSNGEKAETSSDASKNGEPAKKVSPVMAIYSVGASVKKKDILDEDGEEEKQKRDAQEILASVDEQFEICIFNEKQAGGTWTIDGENYGMPKVKIFEEEQGNEDHADDKFKIFENAQGQEKKKIDKCTVFRTLESGRDEIKYTFEGGSGKDAGEELISIFELTVF